MAGMRYRVAVLFPAEAAERPSIRLEDTRYAGIATALREAGIDVEGAPYADEAVDDVRAQLCHVDGVLVWVNPVDGGRTRMVLDAMLADVAEAGVFVSAHPDVIRKIGTKEVLYRTRTMAWGCDTRLYPSMRALRAELPRCLATGKPRVLKQIRGNGGNGVWKVEAAAPVPPGTAALAPDTRVRVRHARRGSAEEEMTLDAFLRQWEPYFAADGRLIDQAYQPRLTEGMVRCYLAGDRVAGFGEQRVNALYPAAPGADPRTPPIPGPRLYFPPTRPDFQSLKGLMEGQWVAQLCAALDIESTQLPVIWDADFLYGEKDEAGADTYVLCEINVSSVYPFPDEALAPLAATALARLDARR
jgi:Domain of unknown function (DUF6815)